MHKYWMVFVLASCLAAHGTFAQNEKDRKLNRKGVELVHEFEHEKAIKLFTEAIEINPNMQIYYINRGGAYKALEKYDMALADYNKALNFTSPRYFILRVRADIYKELQRYDEAIADYDTILMTRNSEYEHYLHRAEVKELKNDLEGALADYDSVLLLKPDYPTAYRRRAAFYRTLGREESALADYDKLIRLIPDDYLLYVSRADLKYEMGDYKGALDDIDKAISIDYYYGPSHMARAIYLFELDKDEMACASMQQGIEMAEQVTKYPELVGRCDGSAPVQDSRSNRPSAR